MATQLLKKIYHAIPFKRQVFQLIRPFPIPKTIYKHLYFRGDFEVKFAPYKFKIRNYGFQIENQLFWLGLVDGWEKISMGLWIELCKTSTSILDIGANTGIFSLTAKAVNPNSKVYGFEPVARVFDKFQTNCLLNNFDVHCSSYALSNFDGEAVIYDTDSEHVYSVTVNKNMITNTSQFFETKIKTKKLSTFIKEHNIKHIDLIKIDVETHEPEVLEGMENYLAEFQPTLLIEILNDEVGQKVQAIIKDIDYLYFTIDEENPPKRVEKINQSDFHNYLICKKEIAQRLKLIA